MTSKPANQGDLINHPDWLVFNVDVIDAILYDMLCYVVDFATDPGLLLWRYNSCTVNMLFEKKVNIKIIFITALGNEI